MAEVAITEDMLQALKARIDTLNDIAQDAATPLDQVEAAGRQARELRDRQVRLEAARFDAASADYRAAIAELGGALDELNEALASIARLTEALETAGKVLGILDKLVKLAGKVV